MALFGHRKSKGIDTSFDAAFEDDAAAAASQAAADVYRAAREAVASAAADAAQQVEGSEADAAASAGAAGPAAAVSDRAGVDLSELPASETYRAAREAVAMATAQAGAEGGAESGVAGAESGSAEGDAATADAAAGAEAPAAGAAAGTVATAAAAGAAASAKPGASASEAGSFPTPNQFSMAAERIPTDASALSDDADLPFDADDALLPDADSEEFLVSGKNEYFVDDAQQDYYAYGDKVHNVHEDFVKTPGGAHAGGPKKKATRREKLDALPAHPRRSRRMRVVLVIVSILLIALLGALIFFGWQLIQEGNQIVQQQQSSAQVEVQEVQQTEQVTRDAETAVTKKVDAPNLTAVMGLGVQEATEAIGHGAMVAHDIDVSGDLRMVKRRITVVLTEDPADSKSGAPTVYLGTDRDGKVIMAGYSAATASLGYGSLSFADAVTNEHIVENTLREVGLKVDDGAAVLPERSQYSTYASDGTTLTREQCAFEGVQEAGGQTFDWSSVLVYNYTAANASGNLADTVRQIFTYISLPGAQDEDPQAVAEAEEAAAAAAEAERVAAEEAAAAEAAAAEAAAAEAAAAEGEGEGEGE